MEDRRSRNRRPAPSSTSTTTAATGATHRGRPVRSRSSRRLNIFSMRSVIRKPPTTFVLEQATAIRPNVVLRGSWAAPATSRDPTSEIPDIALVADMSGVWSSGGTPVMRWYPRNPASMKM